MNFYDVKGLPSHSTKKNACKKAKFTRTQILPFCQGKDRLSKNNKERGSDFSKTGSPKTTKKEGQIFLLQKISPF